MQRWSWDERSGEIHVLLAGAASPDCLSGCVWSGVKRSRGRIRRSSHAALWSRLNYAHCSPAYQTGLVGASELDQRQREQGQAQQLIQHSLLVQLMLGNSLAFLTVTIFMTRLWSVSLPGCHSENRPLEDMFESREWSAIKLSSSQDVYQSKQLEQQEASAVMA